MNSRQRQAKTLRNFRKIHRYTGVFLCLFFLFISLTGLLLGWKSNSYGTIIPTTQVGTSTDLSTWLSMEELHERALTTLKDSIGSELSTSLDRIDVRKNKGVVKFVFENHYWEIQLDGATGNVLHLGKRHSDWLEDVHDGSIIDQFFETEHHQFKLFYTTTMGLALFVFTFTGFWMWYGPKRMRKNARKSS